MDWKTSGGVKIERAKEHLGNLETELSTFLKTNPYGVVTEIEKDTGDRITRARIYSAPPPRLAAIAGDVLHNLRSALDCLWACACGGANRGASLTDGLEFTIHRTERAFLAKCSERIHGKEKARKKAAMERWKELKPYRGGNEILWCLHRASIEDKHGGAAPIFVFMGGLDFRYTPLPPGHIRGIAEGMTQLGQNWQRFTMPDDALEVVDETAVLLREPADVLGKTYMDIQVALEVAFGDSEVIYGRPITPTLHKFACMVDGIVETFSVAGLIHD
jgi:hypothetical protein